jgi:hypothetical protein
MKTYKIPLPIYEQYIILAHFYVSMTFSITTISIRTLSKPTFSIMTLTREGLFVTLFINDIA